MTATPPPFSLAQSGAGGGFHAVHPGPARPAAPSQPQLHGAQATSHGAAPAGPLPRARSPFFWLIPGVLAGAFLLGLGALYRALDEAAGPASPPPRATREQRVLSSPPPPELMPSLVSPAPFGPSATPIVPMPATTAALPPVPGFALPSVDPSALASALALASAFGGDEVDSEDVADPFAGIDTNLASALRAASALGDPFAPRVDPTPPRAFAVTQRSTLPGIDLATMQRALEARREGLMRCAPSDRGVRLLINVHAHRDRITLVGARPGFTAEPESTRCARAEIRAIGTVEGMGSGLATFEIALPASAR